MPLKSALVKPQIVSFFLTNSQILEAQLISFGFLHHAVTFLLTKKGSLNVIQLDEDDQ